jgi:alpha-tubulin suppressor-like RCC1 family protein
VGTAGAAGRGPEIGGNGGANAGATGTGVGGQGGIGGAAGDGGSSSIAGAGGNTATGGGAGGLAGSGGGGFSAGGAAGSGCATQTCAGHFACESAACKTNCTVDGDCIPGYFCNGGSCHLKAQAIACGDAHDCAILSDGTVRCWGSNMAGELGDGGMSSGFLTNPVTVTGLPSAATAVAGGIMHTCAIVSNGDVFCWGSGPALGDGIGAVNLTPTKVVSLTAKAQAIGASARTSCAQLADGSVACWGDGGSGQLGGSPPVSSSPTPVAVPVPGAAMGIGVSISHVCTSVSSDLVCWGDDTAGELGIGINGAIQKPTTSIAQSGFGVGASFTCALVSGGFTDCWGDDGAGQIGNGTTSTDPITSPTAVSTLTGAAALGVGSDGGCAVTTGGDVFCWGYNYDGEVGNGTTTTSSPYAVSTPVQVSKLKNASAVCTGNGHSCALLADGAVWCWGVNFGASPSEVPGW